MDPLIVTCRVPAAAAIAAGLNRAGRYDHELTEEDLRDLRHEERGRYLPLLQPYLVAKGEPAAQRLVVDAPNLQGILRALRALAETSSDARRRREHEGQLLVEYGTASQVDRHRDGMLPDEELLEVARRVLFGRVETWLQNRNEIPVVRYDRRTRIDPSRFRHKAAACVTPGRPNPELEFESTEGGVVTAAQHAAFKALTRALDHINADAPTSAGVGTYQVRLRTHAALCPTCSHEQRVETAMLSVTWCGRLLTREYVL